MTRQPWGQYRPPQKWSAADAVCLLLGCVVAAAAWVLERLVPRWRPRKDGLP